MKLNFNCSAIRNTDSSETIEFERRNRVVRSAAVSG